MKRLQLPKVHLKDCRSSLVGSWCLVVALGLSLPLQAADKEGTSTIRYDSGTDYVAGQPHGNVFNSQLGQPLTYGTIYWISGVAYPYDPGGTFAIFGPINSAGTRAPFITSIPFTGGGQVSVSFPAVSVPGSFFVGFNGNLAEGGGIDRDSYRGQGFHGRSFFWAGGSATLAPFTGSDHNAVIRVRGNVAAVPVELLEFDIE